MTSRDFAYWLQGFFEVAKPELINPDQVKLIKVHLALVFKHEIDPSMGDIDHQIELDHIHNGGMDWGPSPGPGYVLSSTHGWYNPSEGTPRC